MLLTTRRVNYYIVTVLRRHNMAEHHVREYIKRVASVDLENYPEWDITVNKHNGTLIGVIQLIIAI